MQENNMAKTALHYGAMSGLTVFMFFMLLHFSGSNIFGSGSILGLWIPIVFISIATRFHRDHNLGGAMTYGQGFSIGIFTTLFSATLFGLAFYLFGTFYEGSLLSAYKTQAAISLEDGKDILSDSLYEKAMDSIDLVTMSSLAFSESFNKLLGGGFISLITAAIFMRKKQVIE
ncbi:MAG: DUF4199 domain-containing protein [Bacteroidetes bacterium]|nr:DUF4199 domain-containing protein [Bacteroidota bacterium]